MGGFSSEEDCVTEDLLAVKQLLILFPTHSGVNLVTLAYVTFGISYYYGLRRKPRYQPPKAGSTKLEKGKMLFNKS